MFDKDLENSNIYHMQRLENFIQEGIVLSNSKSKSSEIEEIKPSKNDSENFITTGKLFNLYNKTSFKVRTGNQYNNSQLFSSSEEIANLNKTSNYFTSQSKSFGQSYDYSSEQLLSSKTKHSQNTFLSLKKFSDKYFRNVQSPTLSEMRIKKEIEKLKDNINILKLDKQVSSFPVTKDKVRMYNNQGNEAENNSSIDKRNYKSKFENLNNNYLSINSLNFNRHCGSVESFSDATKQATAMFRSFTIQQIKNWSKNKFIQKSFRTTDQGCEGKE